VKISVVARGRRKTVESSGHRLRMIRSFVDECQLTVAEDFVSENVELLRPRWVSFFPVRFPRMYSSGGKDART